MKKRWLVLLFVVCLIFTTTGCQIGEIPLTEDETKEIAEYSAHLLLKYDKNYNPTLMYRDDFDKLVAEKEAEAEVTEEPTPEVTAEPTPETEATEDGTEPVKGDAPEKETPSFTIDEVFGFKNLKTEYLGHEFLDEYADENEFFTITAPENKQILVCRFAFSNNSQKERKLDTISLKLSYLLKLDDGTRVEARTSLLDNDVQYLDTKIPSGEGFEAVVLFFVDKEKLSQGMKLVVSSEEKSTDIVVK